MPPSDTGGALAIPQRQGKPIPLAVGGLPSAESIFTIHCVGEIVRRTWNGVKVLPFNTGDDHAGLIDAASDEPIVPFFDTPDRDAREALLAMQVDIVVVTGGFAETAQFCMVARELDALQAARFTSQSFSCLESLLHADRVRMVTLDKAQPLPDWIDEVAGWLGLQPSSWQAARQQMLSDYAGWATVEAAIAGLVQQAETASAKAADLPTDTRLLFETLGTCYCAGPIDKVVWPADCMLRPGGDTGQDVFPANDVIALTGPARVLTFGPFMHLPPGRWRARYQFEVDDHPVGNLLEFDVVNGGKILVSSRAMVESGGKFGFDCDFEMEESRSPVENRAILAEGSIGGSFRPMGIWLSRDE